MNQKDDCQIDVGSSAGYFIGLVLFNLQTYDNLYYFIWSVSEMGEDFIPLETTDKK